ncbi:hypothetical protein U1Q18_019433 [Sarracenia purpurea var. burkii]
MAERSSEPLETSPGDKNEVEPVFSKFDANGDGKIFASKLGVVFETLGSDTTAEEVGRVMSEIHNGDGFVNLKEFIDFH